MLPWARSNVGRGDRLVALRAEQHDLVSRRRRIEMGDVHEEAVHRDPVDDARTATTDEHLAGTAQTAMHAVGVPQRDQRETRIRLEPVPAVVADRAPPRIRVIAAIRDTTPHRRSERSSQRVGVSVEPGADTDEVEPGLRQAQRREGGRAVPGDRAVGDVGDRA